MWKYLAMFVGLLTGGLTIKVMIEIVLGKGTPKPVVYGLTVLILITSVVYLVDAQERACGQNKDLHWMCVAKWELPKIEPKASVPEPPKVSVSPLARQVPKIYESPHPEIQTVPSVPPVRSKPIVPTPGVFKTPQEWEQWCKEKGGEISPRLSPNGRRICDVP